MKTNQTNKNHTLCTGKCNLPHYIIINNWSREGLMIIQPQIVSLRLGIWYLSGTNPTRTNETTQSFNICG